MLFESEGGIWAEADARVFAMLMAPNRTARRLMAAERTKGVAFRRVAAFRKRQAAQATREHRGAERDLEKEMDSVGICGPWGRSMRVRVPERAPVAHRPSAKPSRTPLTSVSVRRARAYIAPIVDDRGRIALTFRVSYKGLKSRGWRPGLAADHVLYILREEALEGGDGDLTVVAVPISNMGVNADEIADAWRALEAVEEGYRANAKVQYRIIWNLPHDLSAGQRTEMVAAFCERTFGRLGLPFVAAIHEPDQKGDQRNYHAHICFSTRPCERTALGEWVIAQEKVNGLTDPAGLKLMRALAAAHMNMICEKAGKRVRFTHQTYEERGIDAERLEHVGPAAMAAHERGEAVGVIERNNARIESNEAAEAYRQAERRLVVSSRHSELLRRRVTLDATRARVARGAEMVKSLLDRARSLVPAIAPGAHVAASADRILKVIAVRKRAEAIVTAAKPAPSLGKLILVTIAVRRGSAAFLDRIGEASKRANVELRSAVAATLLRRGATLSTISNGMSRQRPRPVEAVTDLTLKAAMLATGGDRTRAPAFSATKAAALGHTSDRIGLRLDAGAPDVALAPQRPKTNRVARVATSLAAGIDTARRSAMERQRRIDDTAKVLAALDIRRLQRDAEESREQTRQTEIERQRSDEQRRQNEAELVNRRQRAAEIAEACRLIRTARSKPYRISGKTVALDLSIFTGKDRALFNLLGGDQQLVEALRARFDADRHTDQKREAAAIETSEIPDTAALSARPVENAVPVAADADRQSASTYSDERLAKIHNEGLQELADLDPWVRAPAKGIFAITDTELATLGKDRDWLDGKAVQQALRDIADDQTGRILGALDHLAWERKQLTARSPYADLNPALARWSRDEDFFIYLYALAPHLDRGHAGDAGLALPSDQAETPRIGEPTSAIPVAVRRPVPPWLRGQGSGLGD